MPNDELNKILLKTPELLSHSLRVFFCVQRILNYLPDTLVTKQQAADLLSAALLHDIGKSTWDNKWFTLPRHSIRNQDWTVMQTHPIQSINIINDTGLVISDNAKKIILSHHERPGGVGYPYGEEPDFYSIILIAADVYSACTEPRGYRHNPLSHEVALKEVAKVAPDIIISALKKLIKGGG